MKRAVLYLRVSTLDQTTTNRARASSGCRTGRLGNRSGLQGPRHLRGEGKGQAAAIRCPAQGRGPTRVRRGYGWSVDRLGRSLQDLVGFLSEIHAAGVDLFLHQQGIDTTSPGGKAMFQMLGVFAEFERSIIQERVRVGTPTNNTRTQDAEAA